MLERRTEFADDILRVEFTNDLLDTLMDPKTVLLMKSFYRALSHWRHYPLTLLENRLQALEAIVFYAKKLASPLPCSLILQGEVLDEIGRLAMMHGDEDDDSVTETSPSDPTSHHQIFTAQEVSVIGPYIFSLFNELSCAPESNEMLRSSAVDCLEKLYCTPRTALMLNLVSTVDSEDGCNQLQVKECPLRLLTTDALRVRDILVKGRCSENAKAHKKEQESPFRNILRKVRTRCNKQASKSSLQAAGEHEMEIEDNIVWRHDHSSIGTIVSKEIEYNAHAYQEDMTNKKRSLSTENEAEGSSLPKAVVHGRVTGYLPLKTQVATRHNLNIYKVEFEDGSISELYDAQLRDAELLYNKAENWTVNHELINANMAKYFPDSIRKKHGQSKPEMKLFCGIVTKYSPAVEGESVALFHIEYEDGDQEDMDFDELKVCMELYAQHFSA